MNTFSRYFERRSHGKSSNKSTVHLVDGAPDSVRDICHAAHGDMLPDNHRFHMILDCFNAIEAEGGDVEAARSTLEPPIYTSELTAWLASRNDRYSYCDQALELQGAMAGDTPTIDLLRWGYLMELWEVFDVIAEFYTKQSEEQDDA